MGYAAYYNGQLEYSGVFVAPEGDAVERLRGLFENDLSTVKYGYDVLVVEKMFRYNAPLVWSVAAAILAIRAPIVIEMPVRMWQAQLDDSYVKSDERDAIEIGKTLVNLARTNI